MANGNGTADVAWTRFYSAIATIIPLSIIRLSWPVFIFYTSINGGLLRFNLKNVEGARGLRNYIDAEVLYSVPGAIYDAYGIYEFFIRMMLIFVLVNLLWKIGKLLQITRSLREIRKYKVREWAVFTIGCILIQSILVYEGISNIKHDGIDDPSWWHGFFFDFLGQEFPENIPDNSTLIGLHDIMGIVTGIMTVCIITLLAPCRKVGQRIV